MPYRNRTLEQLMRSILESQAAMLSALTQMQQSLLSGMALHQPHEASGKPEASKTLERANNAEDKVPQQNAPRPEHPKQPQEKRAAHNHRASAAPQRRQSKQTKSQPVWFEKRGESHHLSEHGVKHLRGLFDQGLSQSEAARKMGLTPAAVRRRYHAWGQKDAA